MDAKLDSNALSNEAFVDLAGDQAVLLAGSGRSGTTWVQQIINYRHDHRVIFEPFWSAKVPFLPPQPTSHLYLRPEEPAPLFAPHAMRILHGQFHTPWTEQSNAPGTYHRRLIKEIRANLLLKWLAAQMPALKIVFLMRHPCAVSQSQIKMGWSQDPAPLHKMSMQPDLLTDFTAPFAPLIKETRDPFEMNILFWAIQNYVPLKQFSLHPTEIGQPAGTESRQAEKGLGQIFLLFYEELCINPKAELTRLFAFLDLPLDDAVYDAWYTPSSTAFPWSATVNGASMVDAWRSQISPKQIERAVALLQPFGLDQVYNADSMPCYNWPCHR